jgi:hypothetical protein
VDSGASSQWLWSLTHNMGDWTIVKTTLEVRDDLLRRAKALALARGITLKQLFTEALEERVRRAGAAGRPTWKDLSGKLSALRTETAKIQARVDAEFEQLDDED